MFIGIGSMFNHYKQYDLFRICHMQYVLINKTLQVAFEISLQLLKLMEIYQLPTKNLK